MHSISELPPNYTYIQQSRDNDFYYTVRAKEITDKVAAMNWIEEYSNHTNTTWRIGRTYPQSRRLNSFKIDMRCVRSSTDRRVKGSGRSKNTDCPAKIKMTVLKFLQKSKSKKSDSMRNKWPAVIVLRGSHNHLISDKEALKYRDVSKKTASKLNFLFSTGHSPSSALHCLKMDLLLEYPSTYDKVSSDGHYLPSYSIANKLFSKQIGSKLTYFSNFTMLEKLERYLKNYSKTSMGSTKLFRSSDREHCFVVVCSPIMSRSYQTVPKARELIMVDSCCTSENQRYQTYVFFTPTEAGSLPLGIIISDTESTQVFEEAVRELKNILPQGSLSENYAPSAFFTNDKLKELLRKVFPEAQCFSSHSCLMHDFWHYISNQKQKMSILNCQELYWRVRSVICAPTQREAQLNHDLLLSSEILMKYPNVLQKYLCLWQKREEWTKLYINKSLSPCYWTSLGLVNSFSQLMQNRVLNRSWTFNFLQFIDFMLTRYEMYLKRILNDFTCKKYEENITKRLISKKVSEYNSVTRITDHWGLYEVFGKDCVKHVTDVLNAVCTCSNLQNSKLCEHMSAVLLHLDNDVKQCFVKATTKTRNLMFYVANGDWPMNDICSESDVSNYATDDCSEYYESDEYCVDNNISSHSLPSLGLNAFHLNGNSSQTSNQEISMINVSCANENVMSNCSYNSDVESSSKIHKVSVKSANYDCNNGSIHSEACDRQSGCTCNSKSCSYCTNDNVNLFESLRMHDYV